MQPSCSLCQMVKDQTPSTWTSSTRTAILVAGLCMTENTLMQRFPHQLRRDYSLRLQFSGHLRHEQHQQALCSSRTGEYFLGLSLNEDASKRNHSPSLLQSAALENSLAHPAPAATATAALGKSWARQPWKRARRALWAQETPCLHPPGTPP